MVELTYQGRSLRAPVFIQPGHVDGAVTLHLGYGRTRAGRAGTGVGFNPYGLRTAKALWQDLGLEARKIAATYPIACTPGFPRARSRAPHHSSRATTRTTARIPRSSTRARRPRPRG